MYTFPLSMKRLAITRSLVSVAVRLGKGLSLEGVLFSLEEAGFSFVGVDFAFLGVPLSSGGTIAHKFVQIDWRYDFLEVKSRLMIREEV